MGNAVPKAVGAPAQQAYVDKPERHLVEDIRSVKLVARIGNGRFLKSYHCKDDGAGLCVKVYVKQDLDEDLERWRVEIAELRARCPRALCPNALPYGRAVLGRRPAARGVTGAAYLVRQHFFANLLDRLGSRPFLARVEKEWLAYQILSALDQCHAVLESTTGLGRPGISSSPSTSLKSNSFSMILEPLVLASRVLDDCKKLSGNSFRNNRVEGIFKSLFHT